MSVTTLQSHDAVKCAQAIVDCVGPDIKLATPIGIGKPVLLLNALYRLVEADRRLRLTIFTGITLTRPRYRTDLERRFVAPLLDRLFPTYPEPLYVAALRGGRLPPNIEVNEFFLQAGAWLTNGPMQQGYTSLNYSHVARHLQRVGTNVFAQLVAPGTGERGGHVSLSSNTDVTLDIMGYIAARRASGEPVAFAGELNANLPYMPGEAEVERGQFDAMLEPEGAPYDLFAPPKEPVSLADYAMALRAATLIKDGGTLQIGIGSFSDALAHALILRHTNNAAFRALLDRLGAPPADGAELAPFETGLYGCTEMLVDGFLALRRAGILRRRVAKPDGGDAILHAGFFVGNQAFYRELKAMPPHELAEICMTAISFTNTLHGDAALKRGQRPHARFVNTAMTATLLGAVSSDALEDGRVVSGPGGQHDLVSLAHDLDGARSIIAVRSTRRQNRRARSNVALELRQHHGAAAPARHHRHRVRHRRSEGQIRPRHHRCHAGRGRQRLSGRAAAAGAGRGQARELLQLARTRLGQQRRAARGGARPGAARGSAPHLPARHRDDRGGADAGAGAVRTQERRPGRPRAQPMGRARALAACPRRARRAGSPCTFSSGNTNRIRHARACRRCAAPRVSRPRKSPATLQDHRARLTNAILTG